MCKKVLPVFLALIIAFNAVVPAFATSATATATVTIKSAGGGAVAAGEGTMFAAYTPILSMVLKSGIFFTSIPLLIDTVNMIGDAMSEAAREELADRVANNPESFTVSELVAAQFELAYGKVMYNTNTGALNTSSWAFDASECIAYDWATQENTTNDLTKPAPAIYEYRLTADSPVSLGNTGLSAQIVDNPFSTGHKALKIANAVSGVSAVMSMSSLESDDYIADCSTYLISRPVIRSETSSTDADCSRVGFWLMSICGPLANEEEDGCPYGHVSTRRTVWIGDSTNLYNDPLRMVFSGTGTDLDGKSIDGQVFQDDLGMWRAFDLGINDTIAWDRLLRQSLVATGCAADVQTLVADDPITMPEAGEVLYLPDASALENADTLTKAGAVENDWTQTGESEVSGFWDTLWNWLKQILDAIKSLVQSIVDGIKAVLVWLFVPDLTAFSDLVDVYSSKFAWVEDIYNYIKQIVNRLTWNEPPKISIDLGNAESPGGYDYGGKTYALDMSWYARYKDSVDVIVSGIVWIFFLWRLWRKLPDILSGVGMTIEDSTLDRGHVWRDRAEREERKERRRKR